MSVAQHMSMEELLALPASFPLETAGKAWGIGRTTAHELARKDEFPCPVRWVGRQYRVTKHDLFASLGLSAEFAEHVRSLTAQGDAA
jgi:hypothetical protein